MFSTVSDLSLARLSLGGRIGNRNIYCSRTDGIRDDCVWNRPVGLESVTVVDVIKWYGSVVGGIYKYKLMYIVIFISMNLKFFFDLVNDIHFLLEFYTIILFRFGFSQDIKIDLQFRRLGYRTSDT